MQRSIGDIWNKLSHFTFSKLKNLRRKIFFKHVHTSMTTKWLCTRPNVQEQADSRAGLIKQLPKIDKPVRCW